jgi:hypothetical protein
MAAVFFILEGRGAGGGRAAQAAGNINNPQTLVPGNTLETQKETFVSDCWFLRCDFGIILLVVSFT